MAPTHPSIAVVVVQLEGFEPSQVPKFSDYGHVQVCVSGVAPPWQADP
jgi:hypothetical protein